MTGHIFIEGEIGTQVTAKTVRADIDTYPSANEWIIHVNSPGGDVYEGYQIGSILKNLGKPTTALIGSMCASIATYDALCCDTVIMSPHGDFMIHLPTATINGTADDLRKGAVQLDRIKSELIDRYAPKVNGKGITREKLSAMMEEETSMSPSEALAMGFVDEVREKLKAVAKWDSNKIKDMDENKSFFEGLGSKLDTILAKLSPKNMVEIVLADSSVVMSSAPTPEEVVGSTLTDEAGAPIPAGQVETADGQVITVGDGGVVQTMAPKTEEPMEDAKKLKEENEALKKQLAEANASIEASKQATEAQTKQLAEVKNEVSEMKKTFEALKNTTVGDKSVPADAADKKIDAEQEDIQLLAMAERLGKAFTSSRFK